jgi:DNA-directed RNA polymerase subunit omega
MARITVEDCLEREQNRFSLVQLASKRTKQLLTGAKLLVDSRKGNKAVVNSLREIASGVVRFKTAEDLEQERIEEEKRRQEELALAAEAEAAAAAEAKAAGEDLFISSDDSSENGSLEVSKEVSSKESEVSKEASSNEEPSSVESGASEGESSEEGSEDEKPQPF